MINKIEELKKLQEQQIELLKELDLAKKLEAGKILYKKQYDQFGYYHLIDLKNGKIVASGPESRINSYCRLRNIDLKKINEK